MTSSTVDRLVDNYLARLADAAQVLPPDRRAELLSEIREHIAASMSAGTGADEAAVRTMLDRLGDLLFFVLIAPIVVAIVLLNRARARAALEGQS